MQLSDQDVRQIMDMYLDGSTYRDIMGSLGVSYNSVYKYTKGLDRVCTPPSDIDEEKWSEIPGCSGRYLVSDSGRVFSTGKKGTGGRSRVGLIKPRPSGKTNPRGKRYLSVSLITDDGARMFHVHRLVADAFVDGKSDERNQVNHKDGNPENNSADNLEWVSQSENMLHSFRELGNVSSPHRKLTPDQVRSIRSDSRGCKKLAREYGVGTTTIKNIRAGRSYRDVA